MAQKPTPEEQLLKLIEGGGDPGKTDAAAEKTQKAAPPAAKAVPGVKKISGFMDYFKIHSLGKSRVEMTALMDIRNVNRVLVGLVAVSVFYLAADLIFFKPGDPDFLSQVSTSEAVFMTNTGLETTVPEVSTYKDSVRKRNPFLPPQTEQTTTAADSGAGPDTSSEGTVSELLQGYKLVGISVSDQPLAMIEEVSTGRTYFLRKDQEFKGMKVQNVSREKVTMTYEGQEADLF